LGCGRVGHGKFLENASRSKIYAIILAHFFTAIFFAWVNLCKKDFARRPGSEGAPPKAGRPRSRAQSLHCGSLLGRGYRSEGTAHHR
jgi:hypothetical protein